MTSKEVSFLFTETTVNLCPQKENSQQSNESMNESYETKKWYTEMSWYFCRLCSTKLPRCTVTAFFFSLFFGSVKFLYKNFYSKIGWRKSWDQVSFKRQTLVQKIRVQQLGKTPHGKKFFFNHSSLLHSKPLEPIWSKAKHATFNTENKKQIFLSLPSFINTRSSSMIDIIASQTIPTSNRG